jgi:hypothetical protein
MNKDKFYEVFGINQLYFAEKYADDGTLLDRGLFKTIEEANKFGYVELNETILPSIDTNIIKLVDAIVSKGISISFQGTPEEFREYICFVCIDNKDVLFDDIQNIFTYQVD